MQQKQPPQRTCIACRSTTGKRELVRVVRTPAGTVEVDPTGKKSGRGAYLHRSTECWDAGLKKDRLSTALKTKLTDADRKRLAEWRPSAPDAGADGLERRARAAEAVGRASGEA